MMKTLNLNELGVVSGGLAIESMGGDFSIYLSKNEGRFSFATGPVDSSTNFMLSRDHKFIFYEYSGTNGISADEQFKKTLGSISVQRENTSNGVLINIYM